MAEVSNLKSMESPQVGEEKIPFSQFGKAVADQFRAMMPHGLFRVQIEKELMWQQYLGAFSKGTDPLYKTRTEHDCQACRHFIRTAGGIVTIIDGQLVSLWDVAVGGHYQVVADAMSALVKVCPIDNLFLSPEARIGTPKSYQQLESGILTWEHFAIELAPQYVMRGDAIGPKLSLARGTRDVMLRALQEITLESTGIVLDLIAQGPTSLYRGEEHKADVERFRTLKQKFMELTTLEAQDLFCWKLVESTPGSVASIRNTSIGTLLTNISEGMALDQAVGRFEAIVAPANYKRPTAPVTKGMIEKAQQKVEELGFTSALERRYAHIDDITINNILFANRETKKAMNVFEQLSSKIPEKAPDLDKVEEISIEKFITDVLPKVESVEVMFENRHARNLVSLIAPVDPKAKTMFKWDNNFSWSYTGEMADSIKERVKRAGGSITGDLLCRLAWDYTDDLDFHMKEPDGYEIFFPNRRKKSPSGGELDVDANGADGIRNDPVENIFYTNRQNMREGVYTLLVNNYCRRSNGSGFDIEVEFDGNTHSFTYPGILRTTQTVQVAKINYSKKEGFKIIESLPSAQASKTLWNIPTQTFHKANVVMFSPNYWDGHGVGNRHYFFMLDKCFNPEKARGFFNEFLVEELNAHRKVLELVGSKMKTEESERQLSGLGFSSAQSNHLLCRVKGSFNRTLKVTF